MVAKRVPIKAAQQRLGHSRPAILLKHYALLLDESAEEAAQTLSSELRAKTPKKESKTVRLGKKVRESGSQTAANSKSWVM